MISTTKFESTALLMNDLLKIANMEPVCLHFVQCKTFGLRRLTFICFLMCQIVILMWTGNNVTRPFRVVGAAALAPVNDRGLKGIKEKLNLPSQMYAFTLVVGSVAAVCFTVVSFLILSKWGK